MSFIVSSGDVYVGEALLPMHPGSRPKNRSNHASQFSIVNFLYYCMSDIVFDVVDCNYLCSLSVLCYVGSLCVHSSLLPCLLINARCIIMCKSVVKEIIIRSVSK